MWKNAKWIGLPGEEMEAKRIYSGDMTGRFAYFRNSFTAARGDRLVLDLYANTRYRLWVNERPVLSGPCKGDKERYYYDTVELSEYLREGKNVIAIQVLYQDPEAVPFQWTERAAIFGVIGVGGGHLLAVEGCVCHGDGTEGEILTTGISDWKVWLDNSFYLRLDTITENMGAVIERIDFRKTLWNWKGVDYDDSVWRSGKAVQDVVKPALYDSVGLITKLDLRKREIPLLYEEEDCFVRELGRKDTDLSGILENGGILIGAGCTKTVFLDAGVIKNGYPAFSFSRGRNGEVTITFFEKFVNKEKPCRRDAIDQGEVYGHEDRIILNGETLRYEPFWVRTFRFVRIQIRAAEEEVEMRLPTFRRTGYPLTVESKVSSSEPWVGEVWEICQRTLGNCMLETYMDCPFYEQMQFPMDTRLQMLFHYAVSRDLALAKKAIRDMHASRLQCGLIQGKFPSSYVQVISTFSFHYIFMLYEYFEQTGDGEFIRQYLPDADAILEYCRRHTGVDGLLQKMEYWNFVDWKPEWSENAGSPAALLEGPSTLINLMYGLALLRSSQLAEHLGRTGLAGEYRERHNALMERIQRLCWSSQRGMFREGPEFEQYTQHTQAWAVLNGLGSREKQREILRNAIAGEDVLRVTFPTACEWFRALEAAEMYEETRQTMMEWADFPNQGLTTCPEEPGPGARSDNHAWSALPLYEMLRGFAGIRPGKPGWSEIRIAPHMEYLKDLKGTAVTPRGEIGFSYGRAEDGKMRYTITLPRGVFGEFALGEKKIRFSGTGIFQED